ncbi:MarR family transcriptional regulator [Agrococcus sp. 1P02AA]|uniref:MarR family winged helix-turn-helix transcriptional regulator n=1 Tax=Agrococcus sp. 1P02AA TaxID=3132259 RepID=UPI0039A4BB0C
MTTPLGTPDERAVVDPRNHPMAADAIRELGLADADIDEVIDMFEALRAWRTAADEEQEQSRRLMGLGENDMRALRFLMTAGRGDGVITSTMLAEHLGLQGSSVTKMLDRLERAGHVRRQPHPTDRRALSIVVTPATAASATEGVGAAHLRRFRVAASMPSAERRAVTRFLTEIAARTGL